MPRADEEYTLPSPLNADTLDTYDSSTTAVENKIPVMGASGYLPDNSTDTTALKTATGEVSTSDVAFTFLTLPGGEYGFYPQIKNSGAGGVGATIGAVAGQSPSGYTGTSYATIITLYNMSSTTVYAQQRYVTASGKDHWLFLLIDKNTKDIVAAYFAPDHPAYGNGGDFEKVPHPFGNYDETKHEVILVDNDAIAELKAHVTLEKSLLTLVNEGYKPNVDKEEVYKPLHSGRFLGENPELVQTIPNYIKVRKLLPLTNMELQERESRMELSRQKVEQDKLKIAQNKLSAITKLQALGLTQEEVEAIRG